MPMYYLTEKDLAEVKELLRASRASRLSTINRPAPHVEDGPAPEVYVALPSANIPAMTSASLVSGVTDLDIVTEGGDPIETEGGSPLLVEGPGTSFSTHYYPGYTDCDIYRVVALAGPGTAGELPELELVATKRRVYNFHAKQIPTRDNSGPAWLLVKRDKFGAWWSDYLPMPSIPFLARLTGQYISDDSAGTPGSLKDGVTGGYKANHYYWAALAPVSNSNSPLESLKVGFPGLYQGWSVDDSFPVVAEGVFAFELRGFTDYNFGSTLAPNIPEAIVVLWPFEGPQAMLNCPAAYDEATGTLTITRGPATLPFFLVPYFMGMDSTLPVTVTDMVDDTLTDTGIAYATDLSYGTLQFKTEVRFGPFVRVDWTARFYVFDGSQQYRFWGQVIDFKSNAPGVGYTIAFEQLINEGGLFVVDPHGRPSSLSYRSAQLRSDVFPRNTGTGSSPDFDYPPPGIGDLVEIVAHPYNNGPEQPNQYLAVYNVNIGWNGTLTPGDGHTYEILNGLIARRLS